MVVQYSDELSKSLQQSTQKMLDHARAIGELCMSWAALDNVLDEMFDPLLDCDRAVTACLITSMEKTDARIGALRRLLVHKDILPEWREWVDGLFLRVGSELAPLRNRYVHDRWTMRRGEMLKTDERAQVRKLQSRQPDKLFFDDSKVTPTAEVDRLRECVDTVLYALEVATHDLQRWRTTGLMRPPYEKWIPASKSRTRMVKFPTVIALSPEHIPPFEYATDP